MTTPTPSKTPRADAGIRVSVYGDVRCDMEVARLLELELNAERATSATLVRDLAAAQEARQAAEARAEQNAKDAERWRYWRASPSKWASAPVETLSSWKTPKQLDRDTDAAIAGEPK